MEGNEKLASRAETGRQTYFYSEYCTCKVIARCLKSKESYTAQYAAVRNIVWGKVPAAPANLLGGYSEEHATNVDGTSTTKLFALS